MERATARVWREGARWVIQIDVDGNRYTERDYADIADACHAIAQILRQRGEQTMDLDEDACELCNESLDSVTCSQCASMPSCGPARTAVRARFESLKRHSTVGSVGLDAAESQVGRRSGCVAPPCALAARPLPT